MTLPVNEVFPTVQGEATWTGTPSLFIRLQGCAVGCPWCDTKHTWLLASPAGHAGDGEKRVWRVPAAIMLAKTGSNGAYSDMEVSELVGLAAKSKCKHIVITGGEPCDHDLTELTRGIIENARKTVQIETSGTAQVRVAPRTWVTISPKIDMPGGKVVLPQALERADEIKMPVGKMADVEKLEALLTKHAPSGRQMIWLQPLSQSEKATALCVKMATERGWRISIQTHKYLGVR